MGARACGLEALVGGVGVQLGEEGFDFVGAELPGAAGAEGDGGVVEKTEAMDAEAGAEVAFATVGVDDEDAAGVGADVEMLGGGVVEQRRDL